jgi:hypothetical protein
VALWATGTALLVAGGGLWLARNRIADGVIADELASLGLPARYTIVSIGPGREVLANVVVGDPRRPDLVIDRAELSLAWSLTGPRIGQITLVRPRLYGTLHNGHASFGALDKVIYARPASKTPFRLPDWRLSIVDGRGLIDADQGRVAFKADGAGALRDGFAGTLAVVAPRLALGTCTTGRATAFGEVTIRGEQPRFVGPVRVANLACADSGLLVRGADLDLEAQADRDLAGLTVKGRVRSSAFRAGAVSGETLGLDTALAWRDGALSGRMAATAGGVRSAQGAIGLLGLDGLVKARLASGPGGAPDAEFRGTVDARGLRRGPLLDQALASAEQAVAGTLAAPMVAQVRRRLREEERGSRFAADLTLRHGHDGAWDVVVPQGALRGGSGEALLSLGKVRVSGSGSTTPRFAGNFATGGKGLPRIDGTMERQGAAARSSTSRWPIMRWAAAALPCPSLWSCRCRTGRWAFRETAVWRHSRRAGGKPAPAGQRGLWPARSAGAVAALHPARVRSARTGADGARWPGADHLPGGWAGNRFGGQRSPARGAGHVGAAHVRAPGRNAVAAGDRGGRPGLAGHADRTGRASRAGARGNRHAPDPGRSDRQARAISPARSPAWKRAWPPCRSTSPAPPAPGALPMAGWPWPIPVST